MIKKKIIGPGLSMLFLSILSLNSITSTTKLEDETLFTDASVVNNVSYECDSAFAGVTDISSRFSVVQLSAAASEVVTTATSENEFEEVLPEEETTEVTAEEEIAEEEVTEEATEETAEEVVEENKNIPEVATKYNVPVSEGICDADKFTYMSYTAITSKRTMQYQVNYNSGAYTDDETGVRMLPCDWNEDEDYYLVAIGQGYGFSAGDKIRVFFEDGTSVMAVVGDMKAVNDTDPTMRYQKYDGSVVELIVDGKLKQKPDTFDGHGNVVSIEELAIG